MIGPHILGEESMNEELVEHLSKQSILDIEQDVDHFFIFKNRSTRTFFYSEFKKYHRTHSKPENIHFQLAQLPAHLFVSITPDTRLKQSFEAKGISFDFQFYNKKQNSKDVAVPSKNCPLIYNLFGSVEEEDSLILTHDDLFEFLFSILGSDHHLPRELRRMLMDSKVFLFLGFDFEKWYLKLLLRMFEIHLKPLPVVVGGSVGVNERTKNFYIQNFEMQFIDLDAEELIHHLFDHYRDLTELRKTHEHSTNPMIDEVRKQMREDKIEESLEMLEDYLEDYSEILFDRVILLSGRHARFMRRRNMGTMREADISVELNQIREGVLDILKELQNNRR